MNPPKSKRLMIFCEPCSFKKILEVANIPEDLVVVPTASVQSKIPVLDPTGTKTVIAPVIERPKMYKCPQCGRGVRTKELLVPYAKAMAEIDKKAEQAKLDADRIKRIEDGKPHEKKVIEPEPKFTG